MTAAIKVQGLGKQYRRYGPDRAHTLKEAMIRGFRTGPKERFWAVRDVTFDVEAGRTVGVIGANGAGKSTLLRLLAGVERPDEGALEVNGRVGALLELGASFHPELTGLENIVLASVVAGLTRREARARVEEIVAFAQLEKFITSPLRTYSTGMVMRLAFSIASHVDPDVLIVDEALSVGDISFQQRCIERLYEFRRQGVTIVFVSHDPSRIRELCDEVLWLRGGKVAAQGPPMEVTARYVQSQAEAAKALTPHDAPVSYTPAGVPLEVHRNRFGSLEATINAVHIRDAWGELSSQLATGSPVRVEIDIAIPEGAAPAFVGATVRRADEMICLDTYTPVDAFPAEGRVRLDIERLDLAAGEYVLDVGLYSADWTRTYDYHFGAYPFTLVGPGAGAGIHGAAAAVARRREDGRAMTTRVLEVDLAGRVADQTGLSGYDSARIVLRYGRRVVGDIVVPVEDGLLRGSNIRVAANESESVRERKSQVLLEGFLMPDGDRPVLPSWTVVVCTRDRPEMLRACLESLVAANDGSGEILVVDNAPSSNVTELMVAGYPVRYAREERPGLNRARLLGAQLATGEVVIYTDDDTVADRGWIRALIQEFGGARVGAVTGLTMPFELETEAQEVFERYGGFRRGFRRRVFDLTTIAPTGAGTAGSGASMAFRKDLILSTGMFDVELDLGTAARTGGDTYALYRTLAEGYRVVYTPDALNWHRHRRDRADLRRTMVGYGTGLYAFLTKCIVEERELPALRVGLSWFRRHHMRELARTLTRRPGHLPLDFVMAEIRGTLVAPFAYMRSRRVKRTPAPEIEVVKEAA